MEWTGEGASLSNAIYILLASLLALGLARLHYERRRYVKLAKRGLVSLKHSRELLR